MIGPRIVKKATLRALVVLDAMADQPQTITRSRLAQLLDDEADLATRTVVQLARDAANDIRAGDDPLKVVYPNTAWDHHRSRRNVQLFSQIKNGSVRVVED
jgi:hypothetical protein